MFVDSAVSNTFIKDDTDQQLSQIPYEDQSSDIWSPTNTPVQVSQSDTSVSSESSGYWSNSSVSSQPSCPKILHKHLSNKKNKESYDNFKLTTTLPLKPSATFSPIVMSDDNHSSIKSWENSSIQNNSSHSSLQKHSLSSKPASKKTSMIPKPSMGSFPSNGRPSCASRSYCLPATPHQSTVKDPELVLQLH